MLCLGKNQNLILSAILLAFFNLSSGVVSIAFKSRKENENLASCSFNIHHFGIIGTYSLQGIHIPVSLFSFVDGLGEGDGYETSWSTNT